MAVDTASGGVKTLVATTTAQPAKTATNGNVAVFLVMSNQLSTPKILLCPSEGSKTNAANFGSGVFTSNNVSYFVNGDALESDPQMVLSGDYNVSKDITASGSLAGGNPVALSTLSPNTKAGFSNTELHQGSGNCVLSDGSVQSVSSSGFRTLLLNSTNNVTVQWFNF
jgi:hypothetical protein